MKTRLTLTRVSASAVLALSVAASVLAQTAAGLSEQEKSMLATLRAAMAQQGREVTPEMEQRMIERIRAINAGMGGLGAVLAGQAALPGFPSAQLPGGATSRLGDAARPSATEAEIAKKVSELGEPTALGQVQLQPDGLLIDGKRFVDPEGRAERFAVDEATGRVTYAVRSGSGMTIRMARVGSPAEPVTIGQLAQSGSQYVFRSETGKTVAGDFFIPLVDGVLLMRDSVAFRYTPGKGVQQIDIPRGWAAAPLQRGNVSSTGFVMLEREANSSQNGILGNLSRVGQMLGMGESPVDYALMDLASGKVVPLQIAADGKTVQQLSECRRKNSVVNVCDRMRSYESTWTPQGSRNLAHYFWRADWRVVAGRPVAVVSERDRKSINAIDLTSGRRVNLFERGMGIADFDVRQQPDGKLQVSAQMGLSRESIDDVAAELATRPEAAATIAQ